MNEQKPEPEVTIEPTTGSAAGTGAAGRASARAAAVPASDVLDAIAEEFADESEDDTSESGALPAVDGAPLTAKELKAAAKSAAKRLRKLSDEELIDVASQSERARREVDDARAEAARALDIARRGQAEFDNYQKRMERQRRDDARYASSGLVKELLPALDNLDRALAAAAGVPEAAGVAKGVELTAKMLVTALEKHGVVPVATDGAFDPELHEAVIAGSNPEKPDNAILDVFEKGWRLHERVVRPAKVRVNKL